LTYKTGILGGTFDPVHYGHLELAHAAGKLCDLSEIMLIPAAVPPHKLHRQITAFSHRVAMLDIAVKMFETLHVSSIEKLLPTPSFTIDTLEYLRIHSVQNSDFYFITGADAFLDIQSWKQYKNVLKLSHFIVFTRNGQKTSKLYVLLHQLGYKQNNSVWYNEKTKRFVYTSSHSLPPISSSSIRKTIAKGNSILHMLPDRVNQYIRTNNLYSE
jgi:nicotinate-nucleotide adenylyltransferase